MCEGLCQGLADTTSQLGGRQLFAANAASFLLLGWVLTADHKPVEKLKRCR